MFNFDYITKEDIKEHNPTWSKNPDNPCRILIVAGSGSRKANALRNQINREPDSTSIKYLNYSKAFIKYSNTIDDI